MKSTIKHYTIALASVFVLGLIGCGANSSQGGSANPANPASPPAPPVLTEPKVNYNFYTPISEEGLKADTNYGYLVAKVKRGFNPIRFEKLGLKVHSSFSVEDAEYYYLHKDDGLLEALAKASKLKELYYIEPDLTHELHEVEINPIDYDNPDPLVATTQYGARITQAVDAWKTYGFGPYKPVVANIDTGVAYHNSELRNIVRHAFTWYDATGNTLLPGLGPNAEPDDWFATRPSQGDTNGTDGNSSGHGSHTCGAMAAEGNNGAAVAGVCWQVDLVSYKGMSNAGSGGIWSVYGSLYHLAKWKETNYPHTIPVNMSLGSPWVTQFAVDMIEHGLRNNIILVASSGNAAAGISSFPGSYTGAIRVGASDAHDRRAWFSHYGPDLSVLAPGVDIISTARGTASATATLSGTSMAAPHVTGLVGYMLTFAPDLTPGQIKTYIERNADFIEGQTGYTKYHGWGRINVLKTIRAVIDDINAGVTPASDYVDSASVKVTVTNKDGEAFDGINVYLYQCSQDGRIQNYAGCAATGMSLLNYPRVEYGVAHFNMLKPGYYRATASVSGAPNLDTFVTATYSDATDVFEVRQGEAVTPVTMSNFDLKPSFYIQTFWTNDTVPSGQPGRTDTVLTVYDKTGTKWLYDFDLDEMDTAAFEYPVEGAEYVLRIRPYPMGSYSGAVWLGLASWSLVIPSYSYGQYAMLVTRNPLDAETVPGNFTSPSNTFDWLIGSQSWWGSAFGNDVPPQTIGMDQMVYGNLVGRAENQTHAVTIMALGAIPAGTQNVTVSVRLDNGNCLSGDWYRVVLPPLAP